MITLCMPTGQGFGWGACGRNLTRELAKRTPVQLITTQPDPEVIPWLASEDLLLRAGQGLPVQVDGPVIHCVDDRIMRPLFPSVSGDFDLGYCFFDTNALAARHVQTCRERFDYMACGSTWCAEALRTAGWEETSAVLQGIDPEIFHPTPTVRRDGPFQIFSGGKFEYRKSQDLVLRAVRHLQQCCQDVILTAAWWNGWPQTMGSMERSPYILYRHDFDTYEENMTRCLVENGLDLERVRLQTTPGLPQAMAEIYRAADVGLFPNRCEGGTNLVLMEFLACGRPAVVFPFTGHADVVSEENALSLHHCRTVEVTTGGVLTSVWPEPDLDEMIERLEWAYHHRDALEPMGAQAAASMRRFTWGATAEAFLQLTRE